MLFYCRRIAIAPHILIINGIIRIKIKIEMCRYLIKTKNHNIHNFKILHTDIMLVCLHMLMHNCSAKSFSDIARFRRKLRNCNEREYERLNLYIFL